MNPAQLHLAINHVPVLVTLTGSLVLLFGLIKRTEVLRRAGLLTIFIAGIFTLPVFLTGKAAKEIVEELPGVSDDLIERHEYFAQIGLAFMLVIACISLVALVVKNTARYLKRLSALVLILSFASFGLTAFIAHLGGEIRHQEIRTSQPNLDQEDEEQDAAKDKEKSQKRKRKGKDH